MEFSKRIGRLTIAAAVATAVAACGGSDPEITSANKGCGVADQKDWLRSYMLDRYFWSGQSPNPEPGGYATVADYFAALLPACRIIRSCGGAHRSSKSRKLNAQR